MAVTTRSNESSSSTCFLLHNEQKLFFYSVQTRIDFMQWMTPRETRLYGTRALLGSSKRLSESVHAVITAVSSYSNVRILFEGVFVLVIHSKRTNENLLERLFTQVSRKFSDGSKIFVNNSFSTHSSDYSSNFKWSWLKNLDAPQSQRVIFYFRLSSRTDEPSFPIFFLLSCFPSVSSHFPSVAGAGGGGFY